MTPNAIDPVAFAQLQSYTSAAFVRTLVNAFLSDGPRLLASLRQAHAHADAAAFARDAHTLKANSLTFGAQRLAERARALELGGLPTPGAPGEAELAQLTEMFQRASAELVQLARHRP